MFYLTFVVFRYRCTSLPGIYSGTHDGETDFIHVGDCTCLFTALIDARHRMLPYVLGLVYCQCIRSLMMFSIVSELGLMPF